MAVATLRAFWQRNPDAEQPLKAWFEEATKASWTQPSDIKAHYRSARVLKNRRVVFNIKGNEYRPLMEFRMEQRGLTVKDLEPFIGPSNRVYEVLNHKRPLKLAMIRGLHRSLGIPAEVLIAETASG